MDADMFAPQVAALGDNARMCLGQHDATEWQQKWQRLSRNEVFRVLIPLAKRDDMRDRAHFLSLTDADAINPHLRTFLDRTTRLT